MKYISAIVVAGGSGSRMGTSTKKQYLKIKDKEILVYTVECFQNMPEIQEIVVVTGKEDITYVEKLLKDTYKLNKVSYIVAGGKERQDSVYNGIQAADEKSDYLVIHDGARPLITKEVVRAGLDMAYAHRASIIAVPVKDTIKLVSKDGKVEDTPDRSSLWSVQTPQIFEKELIIHAHEYAKEHGLSVTDDSMLVEAIGVPVYIVEGEYTNIKITTPEDLIIAEKML
ncbi:MULTISPECIES: 2-C-methyl-D-erythritol 4-phosphate cytidylyltransferase [Zhenhengia]|uniref:2-C-methyl-D-erythritol 4-phosphate cytidylyltransferase n=1 Tax=Zhenhengia yiwuensis TaxID=2763666 RepID=A0A926EM55_9FIRM|nr:2-C-methyl-D-erythritol 4-phosphate cytidylyltransferase [Zhenhengia yiwuensis]MBC8580995.1 2-C-methyl-D-erythritol 4-phosphate cytidylyltransferase [Zhenhengia yiwuensis]MDY3369175.1 2-C-methyl-D-erythritol 4-phosphate cytidylyltransferase [Zhenhengia yiwuensis]